MRDEEWKIFWLQGSLKHANFFGQRQLSHHCGTQPISIVHAKQKKAIFEEFKNKFFFKSHLPNMPIEFFLNISPTKFFLFLLHNGFPKKIFGFNLWTHRCGYWVTDGLYLLTIIWFSYFTSIYLFIIIVYTFYK